MRSQEEIPTDGVTKLDEWRRASWQVGDRRTPTRGVALMFGHAAHLGQPAIVLELTPDKLSYRATARLYGM